MSEGILYRCSGPKRKLSEEQLADLIDGWRDLAESGKAKLDDNAHAQLKLIEETKDKPEYGLAAIELGGATFGRDSQGPFIRTSCGADVSELIAKVPVDSEVHVVKCPKCGTETTVRRVPLEEVEAAAGETANEGE